MNAQDGPEDTARTQVEDVRILNDGVGATSTIDSPTTANIGSDQGHVSYTKETDLLAFRPFIQVRSRGPTTWALHDLGKKWIIDRISIYEDIRGPRGVDEQESNTSKKKKQRDWKTLLASAYMANWPDFVWSEVVGKDASQAALAVATKRPRVFIANYIQDRGRQNDDKIDILALLFRRLRKPAAKDLWAAETPEYAELEKDALKEMGWTPDMSRTTSFPMQMKARAQLFEQLSDDGREYWEDLACEAKIAVPSKDDLYQSIPKIYGMIGDAFAKQLNFSSLVMAGGKTPKGDAVFYAEEFHGTPTENPFKFMGNDTWKGIEGAFRGSIARMSNVLPDQVEQLPCSKRRDDFVPRAVGTLSAALDISADGKVSSTDTIKRKAVKNYLDGLYAQIPTQGRSRKKPEPVPWAKISRANPEDLEKWIDVSRLPRPDFPLCHPNYMNPTYLDELIDWLLRGEKGLLPAEHTFEWIGQETSTYQTPAVPRVRHRSSTKRTKSKRSASRVSDAADEAETSRVSDAGDEAETLRVSDAADEAETIEIPDFSESESESAVPLKSQKKSKACDSRGASSSLSKRKSKSGSGSARGRGEIDTDTDSDSGEGEGGGLIWKPWRATHVVDLSDYAGWLDDFKNREIILDWNDAHVGEYGASCVQSARFIEASERFKKMKSSGVIDITSRTKTLDDECVTLFEILFDDQVPIPDPADLPKWDWREVQQVLLERVIAVLNAILNHQTNRDMTWLRLGGHGGVINMLRAVEFSRVLAIGGYSPDLTECVKQVMDDMERILAQEVWRRWALKSFVQSKHQRAGDLVALWQIMMEVECRASCDASQWFDIKWRGGRRLEIIEKVAEQAAIRVRACKPEDTALPLEHTIWSFPSTLKAMQEWTSEMSEESFKRGSIVERFVYVYGLYMTSGWADELPEWSENAVEETAEWLSKLIHSHEPHLLLKRRSLLSSIRIEQLQENPLPRRCDTSIEALEQRTALTELETHGLPVTDAIVQDAPENITSSIRASSQNRQAEDDSPSSLIPNRARVDTGHLDVDGGREGGNDDAGTPMDMQREQVPSPKAKQTQGGNKVTGATSIRASSLKRQAEDSPSSSIPKRARVDSGHLEVDRGSEGESGNAGAIIVEKEPRPPPGKRRGRGGKGAHNEAAVARRALSGRTRKPTVKVMTTWIRED